jgi:hypothetical protein
MRVRPLHRWLALVTAVVLGSAGLAQHAAARGGAAARPVARAAVVAPAAPAPTPPGAVLADADLRAGDVAVDVEATPEPLEATVDLAAGADEETPVAPPGCGRLDQPETGIQGDVPLTDQLSGRARQGYSCGLSVIGTNTLGGRSGNANMAWVGDCAYLTGDGVAVVDVADPTNPVHLTTLHGPGSDMTIETIAAVEAPGRALLAAGRYSFATDFSLTNRAPVDLYDVSDCRHPRLLTTFIFPNAVHNLTFSADGRRLWSTIPLQAADLTDPAHPTYLGSLENDLRATGVYHLEYAHEAWPSPDGSRLYIGGQIAGDEMSYVVDVERWPAELPRIVGSITGAGHSIRPATIGGRRYLLRSDESIVGPLSNGCLPSLLTPFGGPAEPVLTDITDETAPHDVGALRLAINQPEHCLDALASGVDGSAHYHDVDDPEHTTFAMVSMWNAGLRLFDVRDPAHPAEVAYINPGQYDLGIPTNPVDVIGAPSRGIDTTWGHVRYRPDTGHIWLLTRTGGFWVLELQPQLRAALGLPPMPALAPDGGPARPATAGPAPTALTGASRPVLYCILGARGSSAARAASGL